MPATSTSAALGQTRYQLVRDALGDELRHAAQAGSGVFDQVGAVQYRASAVLYLLLLDHPVDHHGRCRSCRRPGAMITLRRRPCRILLVAGYWLLNQSDDALLLSHLAADLAIDAMSAAGVPDPGWPPVEHCTPLRSWRPAGSQPPGQETHPSPPRWTRCPDEVVGR